MQTVAIGLGAIPASWSSPRFGPRRVLIVGTLALASSVAAMGLLESPVTILIAGAINGVAMAYRACGSARPGARVRPAHHLVEWRLAVATGLGGIAIVELGYGPIFAVASILGLASALVLWLAFPDR